MLDDKEPRLIRVMVHPFSDACALTIWVASRSDGRAGDEDSLPEVIKFCIDASAST
jgi:hypothetical protein